MVEFQGQQVYTTPTQNIMTSNMLFDQLILLLPKDNGQTHEDMNKINHMLTYAAMYVEATIALGPSHESKQSLDPWTRYK